MSKFNNSGYVRKESIWKKIIQKGLLTWLILLVLWFIASLYYTDDFLPSPLTTLKGAISIVTNGTLKEDVAISLLRVAKGWSLGVAVAVMLGLVVGQFKIFGWILEPFLSFFRFVPAIGLLTLFLMWFGVGEKSKVVLIFYATIFPVMVNTIAGVRAVDTSLVQAAESMGASGIRIFFTVVVPSSIPNIFTGIRLGLSGAIISIVAAEMLASQSGLGYLIYTSRMYYRTDWIFTGILTLGLLGFLADRLLQFLGGRYLKHFGVKI